MSYISMNDIMSSSLLAPLEGDRQGYSSGRGWQGFAGEDQAKISSNDASDGLGDLMGDAGVGGTILGLTALASSGLGFYHGYRRNGDSFGWGLFWAFMGGIFPVIVPAYAFAQGFGQPARA